MTRKTKQREAIIEVLKGIDHHPDAGWIYQQVRKKIPHISLGTVYRSLRLLAREGEISELGMTGSLSRFDGNACNHYHFRCLGCGSICDVDEPVALEMDERVARKTGFDISYHRLEFRGLCQACQSQEPSPGNCPVFRDAAPVK